MTLRHAALACAAFVFCAALSAYAFVYGMWRHSVSALALTGDLRCDEQQVSAKANPNKLLFVSCGGFLD